MLPAGGLVDFVFASKKMHVSVKMFDFFEVDIYFKPKVHVSVQLTREVRQEHFHWVDTLRCHVEHKHKLQFVFCKIASSICASHIFCLEKGFHLSLKE